MKKFVLLFAVVFSVNVFACKCAYQSFGERFEKSEFIAEVEILKTYNVDFNNGEDDRFYKADIKILKLYKGKEIKNIVIKGKLKTDQLEEFYGGGDCSIFAKKGEKFLIYLTKDNDFIMNSCSYKVGLESSKIALERKALNFLIEKNIKKTNVYIGDLNLKLFSNSIEKDDFAIYKIIANHKGKIVDIRAVKNFKSSKSEEILKSVKHSLVSNTKKQEKGYYMVLFFRKEENKSLQEDGFSLWN